MATWAFHTLIDVNLAGLTCEDKTHLVIWPHPLSLCPSWSVSLQCFSLTSGEHKGVELEWEGPSPAHGPSQSSGSALMGSSLETVSQASWGP